MKNNNEYNYMLLGRLKADCEYYLNEGNRNDKRLWATNVTNQIAEMKRLYNSFTDTNKPRWITYDDILNYEKQMKQTNNIKGGI